MEDKFKNIDLNNEKVKRIVNAAYEEFAKYGENKASLNKILRSSGISKGVFYHYFEDKQELFNFLLYYSVSKAVIDLEQNFDWNNNDIIKRICDVSKCRFGIIIEYPYLMEFIEQFRDKVYNEAQKSNFKVFREKFYTFNIDYSKFKDQSKAKEAIHIIRWTYKGLGIEVLNKHGYVLDDAIIVELINLCDLYYQVLTSHFYKQVGN
ncbi:TetR/AcrR family transcriptional regulator [Clostridium sp. 'deep sea']|uniref:TetR/AcrR family transcriptional regulator n=1 Tax=Clostridium sp. 'deep sea' TaxID=2779445 RepID=UPI00189662E5|nr:TetR/AcrR family transcriptional regulator [Clostridium sp. 'deep sea']QOR35238.1 TetR/AcrR family transcriptional regulator [Clostridium sp. 'deep sea']